MKTEKYFFRKSWSTKKSVFENQFLKIFLSNHFLKKLIFLTALLTDRKIVGPAIILKPSNIYTQKSQNKLFESMQSMNSMHESEMKSLTLSQIVVVTLIFIYFMFVFAIGVVFVVTGFYFGLMKHLIKDNSSVCRVWEIRKEYSSAVLVKVPSCQKYENTIVTMNLKLEPNQFPIGFEFPCVVWYRKNSRSNYPKIVVDSNSETKQIRIQRWSFSILIVIGICFSIVGFVVSSFILIYSTIALSLFLKQIEKRIHNNHIELKTETNDTIEFVQVS